MNETNSLISDTLSSLSDYLPKLILACDLLTEKIQTSHAEWIDMFQSFIEGLEWVISAVTGIRSISPDRLGEMEIGKLTSKLNECMEAIENEDYVLLGDFFQYELKPVLIHLYQVVQMEF